MSDSRGRSAEHSWSGDQAGRMDSGDDGRNAVGAGSVEVRTLFRKEMSMFLYIDAFGSGITDCY